MNLWKKIKSDMSSVGKIEMHPKFDGKQNDNGHSAFVVNNKLRL